MESAVKLLEKAAKAMRDEETDKIPNFSCNNGPNLRTLLDSAAIYPDDQRIYCVYRSFDTECRELAMKTLGIVSLDLKGEKRGDGGYLILVRVIIPDNGSVTVRNGQTTLHHGDIFVGTYNPKRRFGIFCRFQ